MAPGDSAPSRLSGRAGRVLALLMIGAVRAYRLAIGSWLPPVCRFEPSCSRYAEEAIRRYGPWRGGLLSGRRLLRCHPFHPGGPDPVR